MSCSLICNTNPPLWLVSFLTTQFTFSEMAAWLGDVISSMDIFSLIALKNVSFPPVLSRTFPLHHSVGYIQEVCIFFSTHLQFILFMLSLHHYVCKRNVFYSVFSLLPPTVCSEYFCTSYRRLLNWEYRLCLCFLILSHILSVVRKGWVSTFDSQHHAKWGRESRVLKYLRDWEVRKRSKGQSVGKRKLPKSYSSPY